MKYLLTLLFLLSTLAFGIDKKTPTGGTVKDKPGQNNQILYPQNLLLSIPQQTVTNDNATPDTGCDDLSNSSITIVPRTVNSRFKITVMISARMDGPQGATTWWGIKKGGVTNPLTLARWTTGGSTYLYDTVTMVYIDSPKTTSPVIYKACAVRCASICSAGTVTVNQNYQNSFILVEEILN